MISSLRSALIQWSKSRSFAGFKGLSIYEVMSFIWQEIKKDNVMMRANSMAFSFFISLFPLIIVGITLITYIPYSSAESFLEFKLLEFFPDEFEIFITDLVSELNNIKRGGLLSIGFLAALFFSSNGMINMMRGFNKEYKISFKRRSGLKKRGIAILLTFFLFLLGATSVILILLGNRLTLAALDLLNLSRFAVNMLTVVKWMAILFLFYSIISVIYKLGPSFRRKVSFFSPGTILATILSILCTLILSYIANQFGAWNKIYGSIGSLVLIMVWFQLNSLILLIGFELNTSIIVNQDTYRLMEAEEVAQDVDTP